MYFMSTLPKGIPTLNKGQIKWSDDNVLSKLLRKKKHSLCYFYILKKPRANFEAPLTIEQ